MNIVFWNGKFYREEKVKIPLSDRGFLFGDGIFTTLKVQNGLVEEYSRHLMNLERQCQEIGIAPPALNWLWIEELILKNRATHGVWRLKIIVTGGSAEDMCLPSQRSGQLIMTLKPYSGPSYSPLRLGLYPVPIYSATAHMKSLAYLERLLIKDYALKNNFDDCVVKDHEGHILESAFANLFWRSSGQIYVPHPSLPYYFGASFGDIVQVVDEFQFVKAKEIPHDAQVYLCNSMIGICPVVSIDKQPLSRDLTFEKQLQEALLQKSQRSQT